GSFTSALSPRSRGEGWGEGRKKQRRNSYTPPRPARGERAGVRGVETAQKAFDSAPEILGQQIEQLKVTE
ncbi:MAG: hypothetical protein WCA45_13930, partial [Thiobacillaceae bacterium]